MLGCWPVWVVSTSSLYANILHTASAPTSCSNGPCSLIYSFFILSVFLPVYFFFFFFLWCSVVVHGIFTTLVVLWIFCNTSLLWINFFWMALFWASITLKTKKQKWFILIRQGHEGCYPLTIFIRQQDCKSFSQPCQYFLALKQVRRIYYDANNHFWSAWALWNNDCNCHMSQRFKTYSSNMTLSTYSCKIIIFIYIWNQTLPISNNSFVQFIPLVLTDMNTMQNLVFTKTEIPCVWI